LLDHLFRWQTNPFVILSIPTSAVLIFPNTSHYGPPEVHFSTQYHVGRGGAGEGGSPTPFIWVIPFGTSFHHVAWLALYPVLYPPYAIDCPKRPAICSWQHGTVPPLSHAQQPPPAQSQSEMVGVGPTACRVVCRPRAGRAREVRLSGRGMSVSIVHWTWVQGVFSAGLPLESGID
jgi:hypothetical protein